MRLRNDTVTNSFERPALMMVEMAKRRHVLDAVKYNLPRSFIPVVTLRKDVPSRVAVVQQA